MHQARNKRDTPKIRHRMAVSRVGMMPGRSVIIPSTISIPYTRIHAIVSCCRIPGTFIHTRALSFAVNSCSSPRTPVTRTIRPARTRIVTARYPG